MSASKPKKSLFPSHLPAGLVSVIYASGAHQYTAGSQADLDSARDNAVNRGRTFRIVRREFSRYVWPGGCPIFYLVSDGGALCSRCANKNIRLCLDDPTDKQWHVVAGEINYDDPSLYCDNCYDRIESAYADDDAQQAA